MNYQQKKNKRRKNKLANLKNENRYLLNDKKNKFLNWLWKKYKVGKFDFTSRQKNIIYTLAKIRKVSYSGSIRVYKFISELNNQSFYIVLAGFGDRIFLTDDYSLTPDKEMIFTEYANKSVKCKPLKSFKSSL